MLCSGSHFEVIKQLILTDVLMEVIKLNDAYKKLRNPLPQILAVLSMVFSFMGFVQYFDNLTIENTPLYLLITNIFIIITSVLCFLILFFPYPKNHEEMKKSAFKLMVLDVAILYSMIISCYNIYFFMAANYAIYLTAYWTVGMITMFVCLIAFLYGVYLLSNTPFWLKGKEKEEKISGKIIAIIILWLFSLLIVVQKIIEYILIPNINESKFVIFSVGIMMVMIYFIVLMLYIHYTQVLSDYELDDADKFFE